MKLVKILGSGCAKCNTLEMRVNEIVTKNQLDCIVEKVTDLSEMIRYGIMMTPALIVDDELKTVGSVPKEKQLLAWLSDGKS